MDSRAPHPEPATTDPSDPSVATGNARPVRRRTFRKLFFRVWLVLAAGFVFYLWYSYRASGFPSNVLDTDRRVAVAFAPDSISFHPTLQLKQARLIFIPGAMVEPTAYAPLARSVAERGYAVTIVKLPWRMASSESQRQTVVSRVDATIRSGYPSTRWVVAGHSVGGAVACQVARDHADRLSGLVLLGTSHPRDFDLSGLSLDVTKIVATNDGLASLPEVEANARLLPQHTHWARIEGGNHSQFGYYGFQLGDRRATISRADQQAATTDAIVAALNRADHASGR